MHPYPRAYPKISSEENLVAIAKEDLKQQAKNDYISALKIANHEITDDEINQALLSPAAQRKINQVPKPQLISARLKLLQQKHQTLTIDVTSNVKLTH